MRALLILLLSIVSFLPVSYESVSANALTDSSSIVELEDPVTQEVSIWTTEIERFAFLGKQSYQYSTIGDYVLSYDMLTSYAFDIHNEPELDVAKILSVKVNATWCSEQGPFGLWCVDKRNGTFDVLSSETRYISRYSSTGLSNETVYPAYSAIGKMSDLRNYEIVNDIQVIGGRTSSIENRKYYFVLPVSLSFDNWVISVTYENSIANVIENPVVNEDGEPLVVDGDAYGSILDLSDLFGSNDYSEWIKWILIGALVLIIVKTAGGLLSLFQSIIALLVLIGKGIKGVFKLLTDIIKVIATVIVWIVKAPFRLFRFLFKPHSRSIDQAWQKVRSK